MTASDDRVPWEKLYDYVLECGMEHDPVRFVAAVLDNIGEIVPFDQGLAYCLDENREVRGEHRLNMKSRWSTMYREYYSRIDMVDFGLKGQVCEAYDLPLVRLIDWGAQPVDEFLANYIIARGVKSTLSFVLFDLHGIPRATFSLDRTRAERFTGHDVHVLRLAAAAVGNLYKNFFTDPADVPGSKPSLRGGEAEKLLTKREREVVDLLCCGFPPARIAEALHINVSTTYKHIQHIYSKLQVSSQQELLVRLLK